MTIMLTCKSSIRPKRSLKTTNKAEEAPEISADCG